MTTALADPPAAPGVAPEVAALVDLLIKLRPGRTVTVGDVTWAEYRFLLDART